MKKDFKSIVISLLKARAFNAQCREPDKIRGCILVVEGMEKKKDIIDYIADNWPEFLFWISKNIDYLSREMTVSEVSEAVEEIDKRFGNKHGIMNRSVRKNFKKIKEKIKKDKE